MEDISIEQVATTYVTVLPRPVSDDEVFTNEIRALDGIRHFDFYRESLLFEVAAPFDNDDTLVQVRTIIRRHLVA